MTVGLSIMTKKSICMSQNNQQDVLDWLARQARVLLKRVEMLEFEKEKTKVVKGADAKSVELVYKLGPFESNAVSMLMDKYETSVFVNEYAPVPDVHAAQALVNESVVS